MQTLEQMDPAAMSSYPPGVLPSQWIKAALKEGLIRADEPVTETQIQPNSLDLRLGTYCYRIQCSFLPGQRPIQECLQDLSWYRINLDDQGVVLERNQVYLFPLMESLQLPEKLSGHANPKSTTGRLDVFTRVVVEGGVQFDAIPAGYRGPLYLEVVPRSFALKVRPGDSLAQVRFQAGKTVLSDQEVESAIDTILTEPDGSRPPKLLISEGVFLTASFAGVQGTDVIGYRAKRNTRPIDYRELGSVDPRLYWEPVRAQQGPVILEPDEFYIFASHELMCLPPGLCAEMVPFDAGSGELRTHYAGFFDSGFGYQEGAAAVLEIRNRDVPFLLAPGHALCRLIFFPTSENPDVLYGQAAKSNYQGQRLRLAKQFAPLSAPDFLA